MSWDGFPRRKWLGHPPELWIGAALYLGLGSIVIPVAASAGLPDAARLGVGLLPMLPLLLVAHAVVVMVRQEDELHRRILLEGIAYAAGIVMSASFLLGLLEGARVIAQVPSVWAGDALVIAWAIAAAVLRRRYA